ncbi:pyridoxamine 5'-phosphate oxidase family protein [Amnibacterium kyonggiense]|uniref:General stress protein 26 n=1 Tax=Amnibacterium kyonggiense TaxID=595671 RepID=A0A4R7FPT1_9MICO|nr:pyridoxamine 5'-phosphate oxidase family protein [Amnibacterium kyonggiense]TDS79777.1 general stress protein 26 [Amnibacterium kyonggiense]
MATKEELEQLGTIIGKARIGIITTVNEHGALVSRPMSVKDREFDGDLWFFTEDPSHKTDEVRANPQVNVALDSGKGWVSIAGEASIVKDPAKIDELWDTGAEAWFEDGRQDPKVALLKVTAHTAEYWATDAPTPLVLLKYAKAAVTGGRPDVGEARTVDLDG